MMKQVFKYLIEQTSAPMLNSTFLCSSCQLAAKQS
jgi:hypothetical protein